MISIIRIWVTRVVVFPIGPVPITWRALRFTALGYWRSATTGQRRFIHNMLYRLNRL